MNYINTELDEKNEKQNRKYPHYFRRGTGLPEGHQFHEVFL